MFDQPVEADRQAPTIDYWDLADAVIVTYVRSETFVYADKRNNNEEKKGTKHVFRARGGTGLDFSVFGSMELNGMARKLRPGAFVILQYKGMGPKDKEGKTPHLWRVSGTTNRAEQVHRLRETEFPEIERAFDAAIDRAQQAENERRKNARDGRATEHAPPDESDSAVPF